MPLSVNLNVGKRNELSPRGIRTSSKKNGARTGDWSVHVGMNLKALDALRGVLAVCVLFGHARWLLWAGHAEWFASSPQWWEYPLAFASAAFRYGYEAVMVFFVLSGFFIHLPIARDISGGGSGVLDIRDFARRRFLRLVPPYALALIITLIVDTLGRSIYPALYEARTGDPLLDSNVAVMNYTTESVLPALLLLPGSLGSHYGTNGPLWSLAFEVLYYLAYPIWLWLRMRSAVAAYMGVPVACLLLKMFLPQSFGASVLSLWPLWIAGAGLCELLCRGRAPSHPVVLGGVLSVAMFLLFHVPMAHSWLPVIYALFGVGIVLAAASVSESTVRAMPIRGFAWLGIRSYSIYIFHFPFVVFLAAIVFSTFGGRPLHGWFAAVGALIALALSCICFDVCERQFLRRRTTA